MTCLVYDLHHPKPARARPPLAQRHPVMFWKGVSTVLALLLFALAMLHFGMP
ncbi:MAG TPA: hypothetical protein VFP68_06450 [Burkholderiaceae bacterium]|nr:hypothetical protein [Burkholderiaceae bacterium]